MTSAKRLEKLEVWKAAVEKYSKQIDHPIRFLNTRPDSIQVHEEGQKYVIE